MGRGWDGLKSPKQTLTKDHDDSHLITNLINNISVYNEPIE